MDDAVRKREFASLQAIKDNHPKLVLTLDKIGNGDYEGVKQVNLIEWLLDS
jgi:predicted AAA+ superfamily ATPase